MNVSQEDLKNSLVSLKNINIDAKTFEWDHMNLLNDFISLDNRTKYDKSMWLLKEVYNILSNSNSSEFELNLIILNKISDLISTDEILKATILNLARVQAEPNYQMLPKITLDKIKYQRLLDLLFTFSNETLNAVKCIEYIRQRKWDFKSFLILLIRSRLILWFKINEPKSTKWYMNFFEKEILETTTLEEEIDNILLLLS